jgi:hypothetical protein
VCIRTIRGREGLWWHEDRTQSTEPAAGANDEERGHVAVPGRASVARSSSWLSSSFGVTRMSRKSTVQLGLSLLIAVAWFVSTGIVVLALDRDNPPEWLERAYWVLTFPVRYLPGWESWDPRYSKMSFRAWGWYSNAGDILNSLLWGLALASLLSALLRALTPVTCKKEEQ